MRFPIRAITSEFQGRKHTMKSHSFAPKPIKPPYKKNVFYVYRKKTKKTNALFRRACPPEDHPTITPGEHAPKRKPLAKGPNPTDTSRWTTAKGSGKSKSYKTQKAT